VAYGLADRILTDRGQIANAARADKRAGVAG
jgi:hypothetical protein